MSWIHLDWAIRDYVLLPIFVVVVLTSVLRTKLTKLLGAGGKPPVKPPPVEEIKFLSLFQRLAVLRKNRTILAESVFATKKAMYLAKSGSSKNGSNQSVGLLLVEPPAQLSAMEKMMQQNQDPSTAINMVKSQFMFLGIHGSLGYWVSYLFSGFLVAKTPFPLTFKIKGMLQRGVEVPALDTSYVSSLSWYFFIMISSNGLISLWNYLWSSEVEEDESSLSGQQQAMMMGGMPSGQQMSPLANAPQIDIKKQLESEKENLEVLTHQFSLANADVELLEGKWCR